MSYTGNMRLDYDDIKKALQYQHDHGFDEGYQACQQEYENRDEPEIWYEYVPVELFDACELSNLKHLARIEQLEELCQELAGWIAYTTMGGRITKEEYAEIEDKLHDAGLGIEPTENELLMDTFFKDAQGRTPVEQLEALTEACRKQVDND